MIVSLNIYIESSFMDMDWLSSMRTKVFKYQKENNYYKAKEQQIK